MGRTVKVPLGVRGQVTDHSKKVRHRLAMRSGARHPRCGERCRPGVRQSPEIHRLIMILNTNADSGPDIGYSPRSATKLPITVCQP